MNNRFSMNGDGKDRAASGPNLPHPNNPDNEREQQIIEALTGRYDAIEALWNEAEEDLRRFRIPHTVEHCYDTHYHTCPTYYCLWWMRYGKAWRICHGHRDAYSELDAHRDDVWDYKPIIECPLDVRLSMIPQFDDLRRKVIEEATTTVPKLDEAIANFRKILKG